MIAKQWPVRNDVSSAIENPSKCFSDDDLCQGVADCDKSDEPIIVSDTSSCVFKIRSTSQSWAVRVPSKRIAGFEKRYKAITEYLARCYLPYLVYTCYLPHGIEVRKKWYPVIKSEWIDGIDLGTWVDQNLGDKNSLLLMAAQWRGMIASLGGANIAHGNLEKANVIVTSQGDLKLIDYDNMYVAALEGKKIVKSPHPDWNLPKRSGEKIDLKLKPDMDQFPGFVGYLTLLAAADNPDLVSNNRSDNRILFSAGDFAAPRASKILSALSRSETSGYNELAAAMIAWCENGSTGMDFDKAAGNVTVPLPDLHPQSRGMENAKSATMDVESESYSSEYECIKPPPPRVIPDERITKPSRLRRGRLTIGTSICVIIALLIYIMSIRNGDDECIEVTFDRKPSTRDTFTWFEILDDQGHPVAIKRFDDPIVCLLPGQYGYRFLDENREPIEVARRTGFTVGEP